MKVLILGGYGVFGRRICAALARVPELNLLIAGRQLAAAIALVERLRQRSSTVATLEAIDLDLDASDLHRRVAASTAGLLIHAAGPFQQRDYRVARLAISLGMHYIDIADGREFVCGITALDGAARAAGVQVISGASSVPALSGAVVRELAADFGRIDEIEIGISPGHRTERGLATVQAILGYCGAPLQIWIDGRWQRRHGWMDLHAVHYPAPVGRRWLSNCEVPDLSLLPAAYPSIRSVRFAAGLELPFLHIGLWLGASLRRWGLLPNLARFAKPALLMANALDRLGSDNGAMHVQLCGLDALSRPLQRRWTLVARAGDGPQVPACAAVALTRRLLAAPATAGFAKTADRLLQLSDFQYEFSNFAIRTRFD